ncbi:MAG: hypothetical protein P1V81_18620, partial [Planctomycetota bacterium]|nr:hypothetical protein [Planctomycetota bacterium]
MRAPLQQLLASIALLGLAASATAGDLVPTVERTGLSGTDLARAAGQPAGTTGLRLGPGERAVLELEAPRPGRSLGLWWHGQLGGVEATLRSNDNDLVTWPMFEDHDQAPERFDAAALALRPAGEAHVA